MRKTLALFAFVALLTLPVSADPATGGDSICDSISSYVELIFDEIQEYIGGGESPDSVDGDGEGGLPDLGPEADPIG